jgi:hypothetical protein
LLQIPINFSPPNLPSPQYNHHQQTNTSLALPFEDTYSTLLAVPLFSVIENIASMFFKTLAFAAAVGSAAAQRPSNTSICDYYTTALLTYVFLITPTLVYCQRMESAGISLK